MTAIYSGDSPIIGIGRARASQIDGWFEQVGRALAPRYAPDGVYRPAPKGLGEAIIAWSGNWRGVTVNSDLVAGDPALAAAARATARQDAAAYAQVMEADPALVASANDEARQHAVGVIRAWEQKRDAELAEIAGMADELEASAPLPETQGGVRGVLLDLQYEIHDDPANRWITHRVYRWATYDELKSDGRAIVEGMRAELDALAADETKLGTLRTAVSTSKG